MAVSDKQKYVIANNAIANLEASQYDLELAIRVEKKIDPRSDKIEKLAGELVKIEKRLDQYKAERDSLKITEDKKEE